MARLSDDATEDDGQYKLPSKKKKPGHARVKLGDPRGMAAHIRETAKKYNIDPDVALRVAKSEGLTTFQSSVVKNGVREPSWGAFQLYTGGGLGNEYQKATGRDPSDPKNEKDTIDYALKHAAQHGWGSWYGAKNTGIKEWEGIGARAKDAAPSDPTPNVGSGESDYAKPEMVDPTPNVGSGASDYAPAAETPSEVASKLGKDQFSTGLSDALQGFGQAVYGGAGNKTPAAAAASTTVPAAALPTPPGVQPLTDPRVAAAQRQQLAMAMQRLNSGKLF